MTLAAVSRGVDSNDPVLDFTLNIPTRPRAGFRHPSRTAYSQCRTRTRLFVVSKFFGKKLV
ncbi:MAG: hypothetical protein AUI50_07160 [Crenarchaeota archaeon 13_1_40CM_2_52_14]|nr:MAG: hypothetical protein AUI97_01650 [Crenarchaeota archaeon 13_1_40CM_3_52_17]OLD34243.1 MAG: hypothetical protein AUI50_07160 [Crenarchaeota archaeon 13_1_40CM_2_52_14]OLE71642.1 MAG: hypothetical protein AUF78_00980 [archaeon 13_1_20CM_2_51_12]